MKVIDNFLTSYQFQSLQNVLMGDNFAWYYREGIVDVPQHGRFQLIHPFYVDGKPVSPYYSLLESGLSKLNIKRIVRIKANLIPKTVFPRFNGYHIDMEDVPSDLKVKTAILYVNTNNGYTKFKKGGKVKSVANRMVVFDSTLEHAGVTSTNQNTRVVVNFNYEEQ